MARARFARCWMRSSERRVAGRDYTLRLISWTSESASVSTERKSLHRDVANGLTILREISADWSHSPTFFEISTALALRHFAEEHCELVVLETGMGGTLDATNAVIPRRFGHHAHCPGPYAMAWGHAGRDREGKGRNSQIWRACRQCRTSARGRRSAGPACCGCGFIPGIYRDTF